jgi:N-hydroxyarylamine O-acetyltransferase
MTTNAPFGLDGYLRRIGWAGGRQPGEETLRGVHLAHAYGIPFENLDPVSGDVPSLALGDLEAKLVRGGRGGYCYEQNTLLAAALEALGFGVTRLTARVVVGAERMASRPRTHMALLVHVPGQSRPYLADVGFGALGGLLEPVPLVTGVTFEDGERRHRLVHMPHEGPLEMWVLQAWGPEGWARQYAFTVEPFEQSDIEVINWHIATNPRSPFRSRLFVQRTGPGVHRTLAERELTVTSAEGAVERRKVADGELRGVLRDEFGLRVPDDMRLPD